MLSILFPYLFDGRMINSNANNNSKLLKLFNDEKILQNILEIKTKFSMLIEIFLYTDL